MGVKRSLPSLYGGDKIREGSSSNYFLIKNSEGRLKSLEQRLKKERMTKQEIANFLGCSIEHVKWKLLDLRMLALKVKSESGDNGEVYHYLGDGCQTSVTDKQEVDYEPHNQPQSEQAQTSTKKSKKDSRHILGNRKKYKSSKKKSGKEKGIIGVEHGGLTVPCPSNDWNDLSFREAQKKLGYNISKYRILELILEGIEGKEHVLQVDIARELGISKQAVHKHINKLFRWNLVRYNGHALEVHPRVKHLIYKSGNKKRSSKRSTNIGGVESEDIGKVDKNPKTHKICLRFDIKEFSYGGLNFGVSDVLEAVKDTFDCGEWQWMIHRGMRNWDYHIFKNGMTTVVIYPKTICIMNHEPIRNSSAVGTIHENFLEMANQLREDGFSLLQGFERYGINFKLGELGYGRRGDSDPGNAKYHTAWESRWLKRFVDAFNEYNKLQREFTHENIESFRFLQLDDFWIDVSPEGRGKKGLAELETGNPDRGDDLWTGMKESGAANLDDYLDYLQRLIDAGVVDGHIIKMAKKVSEETVERRARELIDEKADEIMREVGGNGDGKMHEEFQKLFGKMEQIEATMAAGVTNDHKMNQLVYLVAVEREEKDKLRKENSELRSRLERIEQKLES